MKNKGESYDLNLDLLVPFFLLGQEKIKQRVWFRGREEKYKNITKECYESLSAILREKEKIIRWENENWTFNLFNKDITFILEKRANIKWPEVEFILKIYFSSWNINHDSFEDQIKHLLELCFREKIVSLSENRIRFKIRFYGKEEKGKPDILISLLGKNREVDKENKLALEITEADTSPPSIKKGSGSNHRILDDKIEKEKLIEAKEIKNRLESIDINLYFHNLFANVKNVLVKKNDRNYNCEKTVIWVILLSYCHVEIKDLKSGEENCLTLKNREIDEVFFSCLLLKEIKKMAKKLIISKEKLKGDYLVFKYSESIQKLKSLDDNKFYKFTSPIKKTLYVPVISGEIKVEKQLEEIEKKHKEELENLKITLYQNAITLDGNRTMTREKDND